MAFFAKREVFLKKLGCLMGAKLKIQRGEKIKEDPKRLFFLFEKNRIYNIYIRLLKYLIIVSNSFCLYILHFH